MFTLVGMNPGHKDLPPDLKNKEKCVDKKAMEITRLSSKNPVD